ncbi:TPA: hypothetical protein ACRZZH_005183 [Vibrio harveyi]
MQFRHLRDKRFYLKGVSIFLWCMFTSIYVWAFSYLYASDSHWDKFVSVAVSVIAGNIGFTYVYGIYIKPWTDFDTKHFWVALGVLISGSGVLWVAYLLTFNIQSCKYLTGFLYSLIILYFWSVFYFPAMFLSRKKRT